MEEGTTNKVNAIQALHQAMLRLREDLDTEQRCCLSSKTLLATIEAANAATATAPHTVYLAPTPATTTPVI